MKTKIKKDWYNREKCVEELHDDAIQWKSEINFILDEMRFLEHLLGSNYIDILHKGMYRKIEMSVHKISREKENGKELCDLINKQEAVLSQLITHNSVTGNKNYLETHKNIQKEVSNYFYYYKEIKNEIFKIVEEVMREKEVNKLIN